MGKLEQAGILTIVWDEDEDGNVFASGLQDYEIDTDLELAVYHGEKCVKLVKCEDLCHASALVYSMEAVCRWNIKNGKTGNGHKVNERGWDIGGRA